jgi:CBS domain-containing protein
MPIGEICNREVVIAFARESAVEAAKLMRQYHVGDVVIVEEREGRRVPVGIVTDRDLVIEVMAKEVDPSLFRMGDLVTRELATAREQDGVYETIQRMRLHGVRRMPVVDGEGALVGIVSLDDLLALLAEEMMALARITRREQEVEAAIRR